MVIYLQKFESKLAEINAQKVDAINIYFRYHQKLVEINRCEEA